MKLGTLLPLLSLPLTALAHGLHGIIPDYHLVNISNSPFVDAATRQWARDSLDHIQHLRATRTTLADGIAASDDDTEFDNEQDPALAAEMLEEEGALVAADALPPDPGSVENTKRHAARPLDKRQNPIERYIYNDNMACHRAPPTTLVRNEASGPAVDAAVNSIFDLFAVVYNLYANLYGRNSIDGRGARLHGTAHYCAQLGNAFWDGQQMLFGDGDGRAFVVGSFATTLDVIGHELTHGVIQSANPLQYYSQAGALNEHLADVFGVLATQYAQGQTAAQASWLIGEGVVVGARALRDMANPGTAYDTPALGRDPQPGSFANYYNGPEDNQGVHVNSGIPNRAFYLFATAQGGTAFDVPGRVWYSVLNGGQGRFNYAGETFNTFAQRTVSAAQALYGGDVAGRVVAAWRGVGVL